MKLDIFTNKPLNKPYLLNDQNLCHKFLSFIFLCCLIFVPVVHAQEFEVTKFEVNNNVLSIDEVNEILEPFIGTHSGLDALYSAKNALEKALADKGYAFYRAVLPTQTLENGIIYFDLIQFSIGEISVEGNEHHSIENILRSLPLKEGQSPNTHDLTSVLVIVNENASKQVKLNFKATNSPNTVSAVLKVKDVDPESIYAQVNNSGTGDARYRLSLGYQHSNIFDRDHSLTATLTTAPEDTDEVTQVGLNYRIPLYSMGSFLNILYSDSNTDSGEVADGFDVSGSGTVFSLAYDHPFKSSGNFNHRLIGSYTAKSFDNDVLVFGTQIGTDVKTRQMGLQYKGGWLASPSQTRFNISVNMNIEGGSDNEDKDYADNRFGAEANWSNIQYAINHRQSFTHGGLFFINFKGQHSNDALITGEQFGIGGAQSIRGFSERLLLGDSGQSINFEYWSKPLTDNKIRVIGFVDAGNVKRNEVQPGETESSSISSVGVGLRWNYKNEISLNMDLGVVAKDYSENNQSIKSGDSKLHLKFYYRFM